MIPGGDRDDPGDGARAVVRKRSMKKSVMVWTSRGD